MKDVILKAWKRNKQAPLTKEEKAAAETAAFALADELIQRATMDDAYRYDRKVETIRRRSGTAVCRQAAL